MLLAAVLIAAALGGCGISADYYERTVADPNPGWQETDNGRIAQCVMTSLCLPLGQDGTGSGSFRRERNIWKG